MRHLELYKRIYDFSVRVEEFAAPLFERPATEAIADQLTRAARGAAANYQASNHGKSNADFRSKLTIALEEADETKHWLRHLADSRLASGQTLTALLQEASEICKILGASVRTANLNARAREADQKEHRSQRPKANRRRRRSRTRQRKASEAP